MNLGCPLFAPPQGVVLADDCFVGYGDNIHMDDTEANLFQNSTYKHNDNYLYSNIIQSNEFGNLRNNMLSDYYTISGKKSSNKINEKFITMMTIGQVCTAFCENDKKKKSDVVCTYKNVKKGIAPVGVWPTCL